VNPEDGVTVDELEFYDIAQTKTGGFVAVGLASGVKKDDSKFKDTANNVIKTLHV
jgi:hypothetical protein